MVKCSICGEQVELRKENRYEVLIKVSPLQKSFGTKDHLYEAFDCPSCGCQMLMQERFPVKEEAKVAEDDLSSKEHVHDSCNCIEHDCSCNVQTETCDDSKNESLAPIESVKPIARKYGSENRKASDVTPDYLSKMTLDDLRAFGEENGMYLVGKRSRYYYIEQIKKQIFAQKEDEKEE